MSGFDNAGVDAAFFAGKERLPRFTFDEMAKII
jgi:hypothetical protein